MAPVVRAGALCLIDADLLMVRHGVGPAGGTWDLPTVEVRPGEALAEATVRACTDLASLEVLCGPFLGWGEHPEDPQPTVELYFEAVLLDPGSVSPQVPSGSAAAEARLVPIGEVIELRLTDGLAELLAEWGVIDTVV